MPSKREKWGKKSEKRGGRERVNSKSQDCCVTCKPKNSKFCILRMPELRKLIFCIWFRRPWSLRPVCGLTHEDEWTRQQGWPVTSNVKFLRATGPILFELSFGRKTIPSSGLLAWRWGPQVGVNPLRWGHPPVLIISRIATPRIL